MAESVEPGYYRRDGEDYIVVDPAKVSDTGVIQVKSEDGARWKDAVAYRLARPGSDLRVRPAADFRRKYKPTTEEEVRARIQEAEAEESRKLAAEQGDPAATGETDNA
jgi:hypothetical protein